MISTIDGLLERIGLRRHIDGLALGGGGVRGFCHIGVFRAFEAFGMTPDIMSGVSAGSVAGVLYAAGLTPAEILDCFAKGEKFGDYTDWTIPKEGLFRLDRFARLLDSWLPVKYLEDLRIPLVVCAADIDHGRSKGWAKGEIIPRVLASCSIPVIFPPIRIDGVRYVDGGMLRNLPAWAIRDNCTTLYGSNCSPLDRNPKTGTSIVGIALRSFQLMQRANVPQDIRLCDYVVSPPALGSIGTFELSAVNRVVDIGYDATCRMLERAGNRRN